MAALIRLNNILTLRNTLKLANRNIRLISTSQKNRETATVAPTISPAKTEAVADKTKKNWVSYGFSHTDEAEDKNSMHSSFFFAVTLCLVWGSFFLAYLPDTQMRDWSQREGYLELRRREAAGLEPISRDYVDPSTIQLPSDEELGDTEIII